jgi:hypothetical protein
MRMKSQFVRVVLIAVIAVALLRLTVTIRGAGKPAPARPASVLDQEVIPRTPERQARGKYLVNGVLQCFFCHSQTDFSQRPVRPIAGTTGGGYVFSAEEMQLPPGNRIVAPNISPDPDYGAGKWKDSDFVRALRQGIGHDGRTLFPLMPYEYFRNLSDEDLASVIVYVRSIPPVRVARPKTTLTPALKQTFKSLPPLERVPAPDQSDRLRYGQYLIAVGHCEGCHTPVDQRTQKPLPGMSFAGGEDLVGFWGPDTTKLTTVNALNLTPHPSGISYMDEALFIKALRTGQVQARQLSNIMPWSFFRNLTDDDLKAMYAYLRTVTPVQHRVDNTEPPGYCKLCQHKHGFGVRN